MKIIILGAEKLSSFRDRRSSSLQVQIAEAAAVQYHGSPGKASLSNKGMFTYYLLQLEDCSSYVPNYNLRYQEALDWRK